MDSRRIMIYTASGILANRWRRISVRFIWLFLSFSSSSPQLFSQLADRPSSHSSVSTHVKDSFKEGVIRLHFFHPICLSPSPLLSVSYLERCQFTGAAHDGESRRWEMGSVRRRSSPLWPKLVCCMYMLHNVPSSLTAPICDDNGPIITEQGPAAEMRSAATVLTFLAEAWVVERPHHNKVCWVSNLQGKVTVPGKYNKNKIKMFERNRRERKGEWETMVLIVISQGD